jgi:uncharacterized membrane protein
MDEDYDKRVYENDWKNAIVISVVFILFYGLHALFWWAILVFGTVWPDSFMWFNVAIFLATLLFIGGLLVSGHFCNEKLRRHEFYMEKISDEEQLIKERNAREQQRKEQEEKLRNQKATSDAFKSSVANIGVPEQREEEEYKEHILTSKRSNEDDDSQLLD